MFNPCSASLSDFDREKCSAEDLLFASGARFPAGHVLDQKRTSTASLMAMRVDYDRDYPVTGNWYSDDIHFFDMTLSARPPGSRGYFPEASGGYRSLGKIFFMPAGHRFRGEGGPGRQQSLSLFLKARVAVKMRWISAKTLRPVWPIASGWRAAPCKPC